MICFHDGTIFQWLTLWVFTFLGANFLPTSRKLYGVGIICPGPTNKDVGASPPKDHLRHGPQVELG